MIQRLQLFPTRNSIYIFSGYVMLAINQGILVTWSQNSDKSYSYNTITVNVITEVAKILVSLCFHGREQKISALMSVLYENRHLFGLYFIPAFLYSLCNVLTFVNLSKFDPTTFYLLLQFRVVITGIIFQIIFKKYLTNKQWFSLILLTIGCMLKHMNFLDRLAIDSSNKKRMPIIIFSTTTVYILCQTILSSLAGVYNEHLLKDKSSTTSIYVQNIFMYLNSIICNVILLMLQGNLCDTFTISNISPTFQTKIILIVVNNTIFGLITSLFLKYLNSILKTFASALDLTFMAIICYFLFSIPIYFNTIIAIGIVSVSIYIYSQNPVENANKNLQQPIDCEKCLVENYQDI